MNITERPDLQTAAYHFERACRASRAHSDLSLHALERYGDHGPLISGCVRDHFPDEIKDKLGS